MRIGDSRRTGGADSMRRVLLQVFSVNGVIATWEMGKVKSAELAQLARTFARS